MDLIPTNSAGAPARWLIVFQPRSDIWWVNWTAFGHFKHVRAIGFVPETDCWVFYDVALVTTVLLARGAAARAMMLDWTAGATVLAMNPTGRNVVRRFPFCCTTAIAHLVGIRGALRPDALYRDCRANGAQIVADERQPATPAGRPGD